MMMMTCFTIPTVYVCMCNTLLLVCVEKAAELLLEDNCNTLDKNNKQIAWN